MTDISTLETVAEISVAIAGFSGIVATFQFQPHAPPKSGDIVALTIIVNMGLSVAALSYLPILLFSYTSSEAVVWSISSTVAAVYMCYMMYFIQANIRGRVKRKSTRVLFALYQFVGAAIVLGLVLNAINIGIERGLPVYLTATLYGAYLAGWNFIRLLLRPIWKVYRRSQPT